MTRTVGYRLTTLLAAPLALATTLLLCTPTAFAKASTFTQNLQIPFFTIAFVPCAQDGAGEFVLLSGDLHDLVHVTTDSTGGTHVKLHDNPQGITGVGLTSGDVYHGTGVTQSEQNTAASGFPLELTFVNNFRVIGPGPGNNLLVHENTHVTINANGVVTADVDNVSIECR